MARHEVFEAIEAGDVERVRTLAAAAGERDEEGVSALLQAQYNGRVDLVEALRPGKPELDGFEAAALGDVERVRELLDGSPGLAGDYAPDGFDALGLAAHFGRSEVVGLLLERGADPNRVARHAQIKVTALHAATAGNDTESARLLLDAGADPNASQPGGFRAIHSAAQHGNAELVDLLLERGADPARPIDDGRTAADLADEQSHGELAARLRRG